MSNVALTWAWAQAVPDPSAKLLLIKLADQANDEGMCWPSRKTLADHLGLSPRSITRLVKILTDLNLVVTIERTRADGGRGSNAYQMLLPLPDGYQGVLVNHDQGEWTWATSAIEEPSVEPGATDVAPANGRKPRPRDPIWDKLEAMFGKVAPGTNSHHRRNKAVKDLKLLEAAPDELDRALATYNAAYPKAPCTDIALATHFPQFRPKAIAKPCPECGIGGGHHLGGCPQIGAS